MAGQGEQVVPLHLPDAELRGPPLLGGRQAQLEQVVLDSSGIAGHVDDVVQSPASSQGLNDLFVEPCPGRVEDSHDLIASMLVTDLFYEVLRPAQVHLVGRGILLSVLNSLWTYLHPNYFDLGELVLYCDSNGAYSAA